MIHKPAHIHLVGDPEENFYILGKKDKDSYQDIYQQISMLCARSPAMAKVVKLTADVAKQFNHKKIEGNAYNELKAYSEGLEISIDDMTYAMLLPELVSAFNKWVPNLISLIPGCSSLFTKNSDGGVNHTRILDYALTGPFEKHERSILYDFDDRLRSFSFSSTGVPFSSLSAMNEKGLTMALHYKHGQYFNFEGDSIFLITSEIMNSCHNIREAIKLIKSKSSISYWGIYLSDSNGEIASIDIRGPEVFQEKYDINDHPYLYFNNRPLLKQDHQTTIQPFGNKFFCQMKKNYIEKAFKKLDTKTNFDEIQLLKTITKLPNKNKTWKSNCLTPSSIQSLCFNNSKMDAYFIGGKSPKFFQNTIYKYQNVFNPELEITVEKKQTKKFSNQELGYQSLAEYQSFLDQGDITKAYHHIQLAKHYFKGLGESHITQFFFLITQYIYENDKRDLGYLLKEFSLLEGALPSYLEDHRKLFILRTSKLLNLKPTNESQDIEHPELKKLYRKEYQLNELALKGLKHLIFPRVEIFDVIYVY